MTDEQANVRYLGPLAEHDVPCSLRGCPNPAVLNLGTGVFEPCWRHQSEGWKLDLVKVKDQAWPAVLGALPLLGAVGSVVTGQWALAVVNASLVAGVVMSVWVRHETRKLRAALRRCAELTGQVEHEGPPQLPEARLEKRNPTDG